MADLLQEIEAQIAGAKVAPGKQSVGVIREIGDGVAKVEGLTDAMLNEMVDLGHGITGLALDLDETEVGVIILGDYTKLEQGDEVRATGKLLQVPVGNCSGTSGGSTTVPILGFACFFLLQEETQQGNSSYILGQFEGNCTVNGTPGPAPSSGPGPYVIQLYHDPGSGDS